jgi:hypothetical protein
MALIVDLMVYFHGIKSTVEIAWDIFRILIDYCLRHLVNNAAIHIYTHDYIRLVINVLYLKISWFNGRKYPFTGSAIVSPVN